MQFVLKNIQLSKHKRIISYFGEKFNEKFDIFYYFRQDKINKLIENIVLTKEQNRLKDLISRKNYSININNDEIEEGEIVFDNFDKEQSVKDSFKQVWLNIATYRLRNIDESNFLAQCDNTPMIDEKSRQEGLKNLQPLLELWERGQQKGIIKLISPYLLYAYTIYPLAFLSNMKQKKSFVLTEKNIEEAFQAAWDSIKL